MRTFLKHNHADQCDLNLLQTSSFTGSRGCIVSCVFNFRQVEVIGVGSAASASCHASPADKKVALAQILHCLSFFHFLSCRISSAISAFTCTRSDLIHVFIEQREARGGK